MSEGVRERNPNLSFRVLYNPPFNSFLSCEQCRVLQRTDIKVLAPSRVAIGSLSYSTKQYCRPSIFLIPHSFNPAAVSTGAPPLLPSTGYCLRLTSQQLFERPPFNNV
jgi:hypothetical protein